MPFLTILRAVKGEFVAFAVNIPPWPLEVPEYPDGFKPAPPPPLPKVEPKSVPPVVKRPDPAILSPTNTIYLAETSPPVEVPIVATVLPKEPTNQSVAVEPPPVLEAKPETKPQPKVAPPQEQASPLVDSTAGNGKKFPIVTILIAGIALLLGVLVVFIALLRWSRRSVGASLITHSMNKHDP